MGIALKKRACHEPGQLRHEGPSQGFEQESGSAEGGQKALCAPGNVFGGVDFCENGLGGKLAGE